MAEDAKGDDMGIIKAGFVVKRGGIVKNWKKRWFVLFARTMRYYRQEVC